MRDTLDPPPTTAQCTGAVLMVRPETFYAHPETVATNPFQHAPLEGAAVALAAAQREFDAAVLTLGDAGIEVIVIEAEAAAETPDALFPNNWFSTHADGRLILYPMATTSRRRERRPDLLRSLLASRGYQVRETIDFTSLEAAGVWVEGTGSMIFDRRLGTVYAVRSPRTHVEAVDKVAGLLGYRPVLFDALDGAGRAIYHTNVLMALGPRLAIFAASLLPDERERASVLAALEASGHEHLEISAEQVGHFAGNVLFLNGMSGPVAAISRRALASLSAPQRRQLEHHASPVVCDVATIEHVGGGGIRCMLAEIFLPRSGHGLASAAR
jgi:hypothetical protein